jgi:hypothetical protein
MGRVDHLQHRRSRIITVHLGSSRILGKVHAQREPSGSAASAYMPVISEFAFSPVESTVLCSKIVWGGAPIK